MRELSAAARRSRPARGAGVFAGTVVALVLLAAPGSGVLAAPAQTPLVQVTPDELRLSQPLKTIAADRGRVAFAFCNQLLGVWRPGASDVTRLGPPAQWTCPPPRGAETVHSLALSLDRVAWVVEAGGNVVTNLLFLVVLGKPEVFTIAAEYSQCCRGKPDAQRIHDVYGDDRHIVFSDRRKCGDRDETACASGAQPSLLRQSVWRLGRPPLNAPCAGKPGPCVLLATRGDVLQPLSVDSGRVALRRSNGSLVIRRIGGALVRRFPAPAGVHGAELMGRRMVVLAPARVRLLSIRTGAQLRMRPLPAGTSAGICGMPPCPTVNLRMVDAARGLVAYLVGGELHLLRLRDGRDEVVAPATDARFGDTGLFYSFTGAAPWPARIRIVPWVALPVSP